MERFLWLLKMQLLGQITVVEKEELFTFVQNDEELADIYEEVCSSRSFSKKEKVQEGIEAYTRHWERLQSLKLI